MPSAPRMTRKVAAFVTWERVARVATVGRAGIPHVVPVCHILSGGRVYFGSGRRGRKVKNVRENPWATVSVDVYSDHWGTLRGVMIQGRARIIEPGPRFRQIRRRLYRKYLQYSADAALAESDSIIIEVTPTHVFSWGLD